MGDRGNILVLDAGDPPVYLYSHWGGFELPELLADALNSKQGRGRISDSSYLARVIFSRMVKNDIDGETGYGIATSMQDNDGYPLLTVDTRSEKVFCVPSSVQPQDIQKWCQDNAVSGLSVEEFIAIATDGWKGVVAATINRLGENPGLKVYE